MPGAGTCNRTRNIHTRTRAYIPRGAGLRETRPANTIRGDPDLHGCRTCVAKGARPPRHGVRGVSDSKPVFAYRVLSCARRALGLDTPLTKYTTRRITADPRIELITARHVLNHTTVSGSSAADPVAFTGLASVSAPSPSRVGPHCRKGRSADDVEPGGDLHKPRAEAIPMTGIRPAKSNGTA